MTVLNSILNPKMPAPMSVPTAPSVSADAEASRQAAESSARASMPSARAPTGDEYGANLMAASRALRGR